MSVLAAAINLYEKASSLGCLTAKLRLAQIYSEKGYKKLMVKHIKASLSDPRISTNNVFFCDDKLKKHGEAQLAFLAYKIAAKRNNYYGFVEVLQRLEFGIGIKKTSYKLKFGVKNFQMDGEIQL